MKFIYIICFFSLLFCLVISLGTRERSFDNGTTTICQGVSCEKDQTFRPCTKTNGRMDQCIPCPPETPVSSHAMADTSFFYEPLDNFCQDPHVKCLCPEEAILINHEECYSSLNPVCQCDTSAGYYGYDPNKCSLTSNQLCKEMGYELLLNGVCRKCLSGTYKDSYGFNCQKQSSCGPNEVTDQEGDYKTKRTCKVVLTTKPEMKPLPTTTIPLMPNTTTQGHSNVTNSTDKANTVETSDNSLLGFMLGCVALGGFLISCLCYQILLWHKHKQRLGKSSHTDINLNLKAFDNNRLPVIGASPFNTNSNNDTSVDIDETEMDETHTLIGSNSNGTERDRTENMIGSDSNQDLTQNLIDAEDTHLKKVLPTERIVDNPVSTDSNPNDEHIITDVEETAIKKTNKEVSTVSDETKEKTSATSNAEMNTSFESFNQNAEKTYSKIQLNRPNNPSNGYIPHTGIQLNRPHDTFNGYVHNQTVELSSAPTLEVNSLVTSSSERSENIPNCVYQLKWNKITPITGSLNLYIQDKNERKELENDVQNVTSGSLYLSGLTKPQKLYITLVEKPSNSVEEGTFPYLEVKFTELSFDSLQNDHNSVVVDLSSFRIQRSERPPIHSLGSNHMQSHDQQGHMAMSLPHDPNQADSGVHSRTNDSGEQNNSYHSLGLNSLQEEE